jgi:7-cyano-7-deazaguanine synthase in queuosine biosynthesis
MACVVVLSSGGVKSAVAAARFNRDHDVVLLHVDHGQTASPAEVKSLALLAANWPNARLCTCSVPQLKSMSSAVRAGSGIVAAEPARPTVDQAGQLLARRGLLPLMLSLGAQAAMRWQAGAIVLGITEHASAEHLGLLGPEAGQGALRESLHAFDIMLESLLMPRARIRVETPLIDLTYAQIVKLGQRFEIFWERTHTCETAGGLPCGNCTPCKARARAFLEAAIRDTAIPLTNPNFKPVGVA